MASGPLEKDVQATILALAHMLGWRTYHVHDSRRSAAGFPDIVLVRDRVIFAELKRVGESPRPNQVDWLNELAAAGGEVYLWTIDDLEEIKEILGRRPAPARLLSASERVPGGGEAA